jgi:hypothetical protein
MGKVFTHMTMSLDGFIADPNDQVGELFDWYGAGDVTVPTPNEEISFQVDDASAEMLRELTGNTGALVSGRHLFDIANGWDDNHPAGAPVVDVEQVSASCRCCSAKGPILHEAGPGPPTPRRPDRRPGTPCSSPAIPSPTLSLDASAGRV